VVVVGGVVVGEIGGEVAVVVRVVNKTLLAAVDVGDGVVMLVAEVKADVAVVEMMTLIDVVCEGVVVVETLASTGDTPFALVLVAMVLEVVLKYPDAAGLDEDDALVRHGQV